ncbi:MAG: LytTR family DNA-binding domain-containing protein [Raineya sp.]|nr:LytTR family DNA-binding domain-containing protein [Raineya sp.]MDW8296927.1 LytTR family DNA-binding domain-containing protein [Raineya sp.]
MKKFSCIAVDDSPIQLTLLKNYIQKTPELELTATFANPIEAYQFLQKNNVDILLLDIDMPEISGIDLLKMLKKQPATILITSKTEFALQAFELDAVDYIVKPPEYPRFLKAIQKATHLLEAEIKSNGSTSNHSEIFVKVAGKLIRLQLDEILFIEALSDYVIIHTEEKRQHVVYATMKYFEEKLSNYGQFKRIHRSYIVNMQKVKSIDENQNVVIGEKTLPIGNTYREEFLKSLNKL